jgi:hypothetical protein
MPLTQWIPTLTGLSLYRSETICTPPVVCRPLNDDVGEVNYRNEIQSSVVLLPSAQSEALIDREKTISRLNQWFNLHVVCQFCTESAMITWILQLLLIFPVYWLSLRQNAWNLMNVKCWSKHYTDVFTFPFLPVTLCGICHVVTNDYPVSYCGFRVRSQSWSCGIYVEHSCTVVSCLQIL